MVWAKGEVGKCARHSYQFNHLTYEVIAKVPRHCHFRSRSAGVESRGVHDSETATLPLQETR